MPPEIGMPPVSVFPFNLSSEEMEASTAIFEVGRIVEVEEKPLIASGGEYSVERLPETIHSYTIELETGSGIISGVYSLGVGEEGAVDIEVYDVGTRVIVGYVDTSHVPFIVGKLPKSLRDQRRGVKTCGITIPALQPGERFISSKGRGSVYFRNDGALIMSGASYLKAVTDENPAMGCPSCNVVLGGSQGKSPISGEEIAISISTDELGKVLEVDKTGNVTIKSSGVLREITQELRSMVETVAKIRVGRLFDNPSERYGELYVEVGDAADTKVGKTYTITVGDMSGTELGKFQIDVGKDFEAHVRKQFKVQADDNIDMNAEKRVKVDCSTPIGSILLGGAQGYTLNHLTICPMTGLPHIPRQNKVMD